MAWAHHTPSLPMMQKCKHTYEKAAMAHHIRISKKKPAACPVAGCSHTVTTADLEADKEMLRRVSDSDDLVLRRMLLALFMNTV